MRPSERATVWLMSSTASWSVAGSRRGFLPVLKLRLSSSRKVRARAADGVAVAAAEGDDVMLLLEVVRAVAMVVGAACTAETQLTN